VTVTTGIRRRRRAVVALAATAISVGSAVGLATSPAATASTGDTAWTVGLNSDGQLGNGTTANHSGFAVVNGLSNVDEIAGGREHVLARVGNQVYAWGDGSKGATGQPSDSTDQKTPVPVNLGGATLTQITTGHYSSFALLGDGTVRSWGYNASGQLGDNTTTNQTTPVPVKGVGGVGQLSNVTQISAGRDMSMALLSDGTVRTWGMGTHGELGNGSTTAKQRTPVTVTTSGTTALTGVKELAGGRNHVLALMNDGTVRAWGQNTYGQVGDGTQNNNRLRPVPVSGLTNIVDVAAGAEFSMALNSSGQVYTWGRSNNGQLGTGSTATRPTPARVTTTSSNTSMPTVASIGCGRGHALAVTTTGALWAWGVDNYGQLGDTPATRRLRPVQAKDTNGVNLTGVKAAHAGFGYTVIQRGP